MATTQPPGGIFKVGKRRSGTFGVDAEGYLASSVQRQSAHTRKTCGKKSFFAFYPEELPILFYMAGKRR